MSTGGVIAVVLGIALVGGAIYVMTRPPPNTTGLETMNAGVDNSRADLVAGLNLGGQLAQLGTSITNTIAAQLARDAANKKSDAGSSTAPASSTGQRSSKALVDDSQRSA